MNYTFFKETNNKTRLHSYYLLCDGLTYNCNN